MACHLFLYRWLRQSHLEYATLDDEDIKGHFVLAFGAGRGRALELKNPVVNSLVGSDLNLVEVVYQHTGLKIGVASTDSLDPIKPLVA